MDDIIHGRQGALWMITSMDATEGGEQTRSTAECAWYLAANFAAKPSGLINGSRPNICTLYTYFVLNAEKAKEQKAIG